MIGSERVRTCSAHGCSKLQAETKGKEASKAEVAKWMQLCILRTSIDYGFKVHATCLETWRSRERWLRSQKNQKKTQKRARHRRRSAKRPSFSGSRCSLPTLTATGSKERSKGFDQASHKGEPAMLRMCSVV